MTTSTLCLNLTPRTRTLLKDLQTKLGSNATEVTAIAIAVLHSVHFVTATPTDDATHTLGRDQLFELRRQRAIANLTRQTDHATKPQESKP